MRVDIVKVPMKSTEADEDAFDSVEFELLNNLHIQTGNS